LSSKQRIELAADLACGELQLHPSLAQASSLVGVSQTKVRKELKARATARVAEPVANLVTAWNSATEDQRAEAIEVIGVGVVSCSGTTKRGWGFTSASARFAMPPAGAASRT